MKRNEPPIQGFPPPHGRMGEIGSDQCGGDGGMRAALPRFRHRAALLILVLTLSACQSRTNSSDYPDLGSIVSPPDTTKTLDERRQIVRDLIEDRDLANHKQAVVRHRSGLSETPPPAAPISTAPRAEDIIRQAPNEDDRAPGKVLVSEPERAYRDRTQFDDGTLNDFIRRLKRDTAPVIIKEPSADGGKPSDPSDEPAPQTWHFEGKPAVTFARAAWRPAPTDPPAVLLALSPSALRSVLQEDRPMVIRLAVGDAEPGFFCSYLGWMVAWSTACLDEGGESGSSTDDDAKVAVDDGGVGGEKPTPPKDLTAKDEVVASEDVDDSVLLPVTSVLDRLRNLVRSRGRRSDPSSKDPKSLSYEADLLRTPKDEGPPSPVPRPAVDKDLRIVRHHKVFEFKRTPVPAFKPLPPEPDTVIFSPKATRQTRRAGFKPAAKPYQVTAGQKIVDEAAGRVEPERQEAQSAVNSLDEAKAEVSTGRTQPAAIDQPPSRDVPLLDSEVVLFEPGSVRLPIGIEGRLETMLHDARARGGKLFIVSEADIGSLAMERARSVGLALVRLGATADVIEYDIVVSRNTDQVRILLKLGEKFRQGVTAADDRGR